MVLGIVIPVILVFTKASAPIILMFGPNDIPVILLLYANASDPISVTEDLNDIFPEIYNILSNQPMILIPDQTG